MQVVRVQTIANASKTSDTIPPEFIQAEDEQPGATTVRDQTLEVPLIDLGTSDKVDEKVEAAASEWGIFQVVNHGIESEVIEKLQRVGREFFEVVPQEEKEVVARVVGSKSVEGYGTKLQKEVEGKMGWVDHLFHRVWPPKAINYQIWPQNPPSYREANEVYTEKLRVVVDKLLEWLLLGLGLDGHALKEASGGDKLEYMMKINYYPPCPRPDLALGVPAHTDMSTLTILIANEVPGLQVFKDDCWYDVKYIPGTLIVHIGDQIEIMSNGKYKAVLHRSTVNKDSTRMSWPVFLEPPPELEIGPCQQLVSRENPPKFKSKKFKDYMYCKLNKLPQ